jgi:hypothetical protein
MRPTESGYYQDGGDVGYVTQAGDAYHLQGPFHTEPVWRRVEEFSKDAERAKDQDQYQEYERSRKAYGIDP